MAFDKCGKETQNQIVVGRTHDIKPQIFSFNCYENNHFLTSGFP